VVAGLRAEHVIHSPFDKIYAINHKNQRANWQRMKKRLHEYGGLLTRVESLEFGSKVSRVLSHLSVWRTIVETGIQRALILEDTAIFQPYQLDAMMLYVAEADELSYPNSFSTRSLNSTTLTKWDLLFFGGSARGHAYNVEVSRQWIIPMLSRGSYAYALTLRAARILAQEAPAWMVVDEPVLQIDKLLDSGMKKLMSLGTAIPLVYDGINK